jgi:hypothetical protein
MDKGLQRVLNLAKKTGDNVIMFDSLNPERSYVILAINKYEDLLEEAGYQDFLTEEEMTDKINRDIEPWDINDWNSEDLDNKDFLPKDLFEEDEEEEWEEDVNYLYPTEDEFTSLRTETQTTPDLEDNFEPLPPVLNEAEGEEDITSVEDYTEPKLESIIEDEDEGERAQFSPSFSSIGELLEEKKSKGNLWEIPEDRQA